MKTNTASPVVSPVGPACAPVAAGGFTLGLDLGDVRHQVCVLDAAGLPPEAIRDPNERQPGLPDHSKPHRPGFAQP